MKKPLAKAFLCVLVFLFGLTAGFLLRPAIVPAAAIGPSDAPFVLSGVPDVRQSTTYSCGAAALQAVLSYWGIDKRERALMEMLGTNEDAGTSPEAIIEGAKGLGLDAYLKEDLTLDDLEHSVRGGIPIITAIQAWTDSRAKGFSWDADWEDGHYVIVIGLNGKNVYVEDPSLLGTKGLIPRAEFLARWHDYTGTPPYDTTDRSYVHLGIFITGKQPATAPAFSHVD